MAEHDSHSVRNNVIAGLIVAGVIAALTYTWRPVLASLRWMWGVIASGWNALAAWYSLPGWILLLLTVLAAITLFRFLRALRKPKTPPPYLQYTEDVLRGARWRWKWVNGVPAYITPFCVRCDLALVYDDSSCRGVHLHDTQPRTEFFCDSCGQAVTSIPGGSIEFARAAIAREIDRKLRSQGQQP